MIWRARSRSRQQRFRKLAAALAAAATIAAPAALRAQSPPPATPAPGPELPLEQLPPVIVTAPAPSPLLLPRSSIPGALDIMSGEEARAAHPRVLPDGMERLTGVTLQNEQGNPYQPDLNLRGFVASPVTGVPQGLSVFLDGVRLNEPTVEEVNFDLIPLGDAELVEVIRGPSVLFGRNTLGAAVNIVTRRGEDRFELTPEIAGGSFGRQDYTLRLGGALRPLDYYVGVRYSEETGWRQESQTRIARALGKVGIRVGDLDATLSYQYSNDRIKQPGSLPASQINSDPTANFTAGDFFAPRLNLGILNATYAVAESVKLDGNAFVRALDSEQFNVNLIGDNTRLLNHVLSAGGRIQASHKSSPFGRDNVLVVGAEYTHTSVTSRTFEEDPEAGEELTADLADAQQAVGAYAQDTLTVFRGFAGPKSSLVLTVAGRWDYLRHKIDDRLGGPSGGTFTFSRFNPKVGINLNLTDRIGFFASYGEGFRAPAFLELTCAGPGAICPGLQAGAAPDPPLKPVVAKTYEVGAYTRPFPWLDLNLTLYRTDVSDEIFSVSPTGTVGVFFQNIGATRRDGVEVDVRARWGKVLEGSFNYAYTRATFQDQIPDLATALPPGSQTVSAGSSMPLVPQHRINLNLAWHPWPWATVSAGTTYVSSQFLRGDPANTQPPLPGYWVVNAGLSARWKGFEGFAQINNLLNNSYETYGTFAPDGRQPGAPVVRFLTPAPPINVVGGLRYTF
jgi:iron complex outermembrane recepter protein